VEDCESPSEQWSTLLFGSEVRSKKLAMRLVKKIEVRS
jgi:hypothetical protein